MVGGWNPPVHHMNRPRWGIEAVHHFPATREDPEDSDLAEVGRVDSIELAFAEVRHILLRQELVDICSGVHAQFVAKIEPYWESQRNEP